MARYRSRAERRLINRMYIVLLVIVAGITVLVVSKVLTGSKAGPKIADGNTPPQTLSITSSTTEATQQEHPIEQSHPMQPAQENPFNPEQTSPVEPQPTVTEQTQPIKPEPVQDIAAVEHPDVPSVSPNVEAGNMITKALSLLKEQPSKIIQVRDMLNPVLQMPLNAEQRAAVKKQLADLSDSWLLSRTIFKDDNICESYVVKSGDVLENIGKRFKVPYEFLQTINGISQPSSLRAGQTIKVVHGPFRAVVYRSAFTLDIYLQNTYVRSFKVTLGKESSETPKGLWRVRSGGKSEKPIWTSPEGKVIYPNDPEYPLGSRWIGLEGLDENTKDKQGFGIHGTKDADAIGTAASHGCIRLNNGEAIMVYNMLIPVESLVEVAD
jgi:LysM repeat protein